MRIDFIVGSTVHLPHLQPVYDEAVRRGHKATLKWNTYITKELRNQHRLTKPEELAEEVANADTIVLADTGDCARFPTDRKFLVVNIHHGFADKGVQFHSPNAPDLITSKGPYYSTRIITNYVETGEPKLDRIFTEKVEPEFETLWAPTFNEPWSSFDVLKNHTDKLGDIKLKPHMVLWNTRKDDIERLPIPKVPEADYDIVPYLQRCNRVICDTSSVFFESVIAGKKTFIYSNPDDDQLHNRERAEVEFRDAGVQFSNIDELLEKWDDEPDPKAVNNLIAQLHPFTDGKSAERVVDAIEDLYESRRR